jgi:two-component system sensor histidine kinase GlrK
VTFGGIGVVVLLAWLYARSISQPLRKLAQELRLVGHGEFQRHLDMQAPAEVGELAGAFNWMASQLAKLDEMKEEFMANMSHELRTPLSAIREGTTLLWEGIPDPLTAAQREIVQVVRSHSERLNALLSSVLDLSKMEAGMMEYVKVPRDLLLLLDSTVQTAQLTGQRKGIHVERVCSAALPPVSLDEGRMQQALDNLLSNAMKFTPQGGTVRVTATLRRKIGGMKGDDWVEVRISDTGAGQDLGRESIGQRLDLYPVAPRTHQHPSTIDPGPAGQGCRYGGGSLACSGGAACIRRRQGGSGDEHCMCR